MTSFTGQECVHSGLGRLGPGIPYGHQKRPWLSSQTTPVVLFGTRTVERGGRDAHADPKSVEPSSVESQPCKCLTLPTCGVRRRVLVAQVTARREGGSGADVRVPLEVQEHLVHRLRVSTLLEVLQPPVGGHVGLPGEPGVLYKLLRRVPVEASRELSPTSYLRWSVYEDRRGGLEGPLTGPGRNGTRT